MIFVFSRFDYCNAVLSGLSTSALPPRQRVLYSAAHLMYGRRPLDYVTPALRERCPDDLPNIISPNVTWSNVISPNSIHDFHFAECHFAEWDRYERRELVLPFSIRWIDIQRIDFRWNAIQWNDIHRMSNSPHWHLARWHSVKWHSVKCQVTQWTALITADYSIY